MQGQLRGLDADLFESDGESSTCSCSSCCSSSGSSGAEFRGSAAAHRRPPPAQGRPDPPAPPATREPRPGERLGEVDASGRLIARPVRCLLDVLPSRFTIAVASKRNSGKTVLITELLHELVKSKRADIVVVLSGSAGLNKDYTSVVPPSLILPFSEDWLRGLWDRQARMEPGERDHVVVVADDILSDPAAQYSEMLGRLFALGRHADISTVLISQAPNHVLTPIIRQNADLILASRLNVRSIRLLWESTQGVEWPRFRDLVDANAGLDFNFIAYDNTSGSSSHEDWLLAVRASPPRASRARQQQRRR
jgi:hypothetical protein